MVERCGEVKLLALWWHHTVSGMPSNYKINSLKRLKTHRLNSFPKPITWQPNYLGPYTDFDDVHRNLYLEQVSIVGVPLSITVSCAKWRSVNVFLRQAYGAKSSSKVSLLYLEWIKHGEKWMSVYSWNYQDLDKGRQKHSGTWLVGMKRFWLRTKGSI